MTGRSTIERLVQHAPDEPYVLQLISIRSPIEMKEMHRHHGGRHHDRKSHEATEFDAGPGRSPYKRHRSGLRRVRHKPYDTFSRTDWLEYLDIAEDDEREAN